MIWWVILFFVCGITLILVEFILPGLVCGILGGIFVAISCTIALYWHPEHAVMIILGELLAVIASIIAGFYLVSRSALGRAMVLSKVQDPAQGWVSDESNASLVGTKGQVITALRPAGTILLSGRKTGAVSNGEFIEDGAWVKVIEVSGNRVVVEPTAQP
jgi:membrane-bound serine protease (ClpP class)